MARLKISERILLERITKNRDPALLPLIDSIMDDSASKSDLLNLQRILSDEFAEKGLELDDEPNQYGIQIENLINKLRTDEL